MTPQQIDRIITLAKYALILLAVLAGVDQSGLVNLATLPW